MRNLSRLAAICALLVLGGTGVREASAATIQQVQSGTAVNTANGIQTITISSVDPTKSFLIFETRSDSPRPVGSTVRGRLASATTIEFERVTNGVAPEPAPINIQWYVATFGSGVKVQRGETTQSATVVNVTITAVAAMNQAFVLWSKTPAAGDNEWGNDDQVVADLTSTTNLQIRSNAASAGHTIAWQVVEFTNAADINVQRGTITTMTGTTTSVTATLSPAVNTTKTFVLVGWQSSGAGADIGARMLRARLTNSTTITIDRSISGSPDDITEIAWQAIELKDGSVVRSGSTSFAAGVASATLPILTVNTKRSIAFGSAQSGAGQNMGRTPYAADDIIGVGSFAASLGTAFRSATQAAAGSGALTLTINKPAGTAESDVMIASIAFRPNTAVITPPAGWTLVRRTDNAATTANSLAVYWKAADDAEPASYAWTFDTSTGSAGGIASFVNVDTVNPIDVESGQATANSLTHAAPSVTPTGTDEMIVTAHAFSSSSTWTPPTGMTEAVDVASETVPNCCGEGLEVNYMLQAAATATGPLTATASNDSDVGVTQTLALRASTPSGWVTLTRDSTVDTADVGWFVVQFDQGPGFKVGSFTKSTGGAPATQVIAHGLGSVPKAIILWTDGQTNQTFTNASYLFGFGLTDGTTSKSVAAASQTGQGVTSNSSSRMANKALTMVQWSETLVAEADLTSWDDTNFTLNWTTNNATAYVIHYIVIGGPDVSAKVVDWTMATATGNQAVTGVGFQPNAVIHAHAFHPFTGAAPASIAGSAFGLGAMDADGDQWSTGFYTLDNVATSDTQRGQQTDAAIYAFDNALAVQKKASWVSMDADGFTVNFTNATSAAAARVLSLALKGVNVKPGSFLKATGGAPASQSLTGIGFQPGVVLMASAQDVTRAAPVAQSRWGIGASDGTTEGSSAMTDQNAVATTSVRAVDKTSKAFIVADTNNSTIGAEANLTSMNADGFTLNWTTNNAVQTQILYLALAPIAVTEVRLVSLDAARYDSGVLVQWTTGYEIDNLGFHVYREVGGVRTRVTSALVGGSGLTLGRGVASNGARHYAFWDLNAAAADPGAVYWLEDVDLNGASTWHGPVTPVAGGVQMPPVVTSNALGEGTCRVEASGGSGSVPCRSGEVRAWFPDAGDRSVDFVRPQPQDPLGTQWGVAAGAAVRISVTRPGWYRLDQAALLAAGVSPSVDPRTLQLYADGVEQAISVVGQSDGRLDAADRVEFFATGLDTPTTDTRVYWLVAGSGAGRRLAVSSGTPGVASGGSFWHARQAKERSIYFAALRNGDAENWFGPLVSDYEPTVVTLRLSNVAAGGADLELALQGVTAAEGSGIDHRVGVTVNGHGLDEVTFRGQERAVFHLALPAGTLQEGDNTVQLTALGGEADISLVDTVTVSYAHAYRADADQLLFTAEGQQTVAIAGFSTPSIRVVDVTDPTAVIDVLGTVGSDDGLYTVTLVAPGTGTRRLFAFSDFTTAVPARVEANRPSSWHDAANAFDYVVFTPRAFAESLEPLVALRASQGYHPAVVDIEDVYDEFSFGEKTPAALRRFLARASAAWQQRPRFAVLAGDATLDPRNYAGLGDFDLIPTKLLSMATIALETASDEWFADFNDDGLPELAVGRLPVRTGEQAEAVVRKIVGYETQAPGAWTSDVTLVADDNDAANDFDGASRAIASALPAGYAAHEVFRGQLGAAAGGELAAQVTAGRLIVNYLGHGSTQLWGTHGDLLSNDVVRSSWRGGPRLPFVLAMNCLNGFFHGIYDEESLAEALLRAPEGGGVAAWASSSLTSSATQRLVSQELFRLLLRDGRLTLGEAVGRAKRVVRQRDVRRSWIFFGDPATRLLGVAPGPDATQPLDDDSTSETPGTDPAPVVTGTVRQVRLADFDGDGRADLLVYRPESGEWQAWTALGRFLLAGRWPADLDVRAANLTGDRLADLFLYDARSGDWFQLANTGASFAVTTGAALANAEVRLADFDGDGRDDVLLYQRATGAWAIGINDGHGSFTVTTGQWAAQLTVRVADLDGDGRADLVTYDRTSGSWQWLTRTGTVTLAGTTAANREIAVGRFDGDARADLLLANAATGQWETWVSPAAGTLVVGGSGVWTAGRVVQLADLTGDGLDEAVLYDPATGAWSVAPLTAAAAGFTASGTAPAWAHLGSGDIDGDGLAELYVYQPQTGAVQLINPEPTGLVDVGTATWPSGWTLRGYQTAEPVDLATLSPATPAPAEEAIDPADEEGALEDLGLIRKPVMGRYGNYDPVVTPTPVVMPAVRPTPTATGRDVAPAPKPKTVDTRKTAGVTEQRRPALIPVVAPPPAANTVPDSGSLMDLIFPAAPAFAEQRSQESAPAAKDPSNGQEAPAADPLDAGGSPDSPSAAAGGAPRTMTAATADATDVTPTTAVLHGTVTNVADGTHVGFLWGTEERPGTETDLADLAARGDGYTHALSGLRPGTQYYFRALVEQPDGGRLLGDILSFRTPAAAAPSRTDDRNHTPDATIAPAGGTDGSGDRNTPSRGRLAATRSQLSGK